MSTTNGERMIDCEKPEEKDDSGQILPNTSSRPSTDKKKKSQWTEAMEICLLRELVVENPFKHRHGSQERGKAWEHVATALHPLKTAITLNQRTVREKYKALKSKLRQTNNREMAASGISTEETEAQREIRDLVQQLEEMESDAELIPPQKRMTKSRSG